MRRQLDELHEQQREPVAALWAAEAPIYGRFGYAPATFRGGLTGRCRRLRLRPDVDLGTGRVDARRRSTSTGRTRRRCTTGCAGSVPGNLARDDRWWDRVLRDDRGPPRGPHPPVPPAAHRGRRHGDRLRRLPDEGRPGTTRGEPEGVLRRRGRPRPHHAAATPRCGGSCSRSTWCARCAARWPRPTTRCGTCWPTPARCTPRRSTRCGCGWWTSTARCAPAATRRRSTWCSRCATGSARGTPGAGSSTGHPAGSFCERDRPRPRPGARRRGAGRRLPRRDVAGHAAGRRPGHRGEPRRGHPPRPRSAGRSAPVPEEF